MDFPSNAFEVEDIKRRENYTFWKKDDVVHLIDTTRTFRPLKDYSPMHTFGPNEFPFGNENAEEYFEMMYERSQDLTGEYGNIVFLAWIDPETGEQLEQDS